MLPAADFGQLFADFRASAFRLELLPAYRTPEEEAELAAYRSGEAPSAELGGDTEWRSLLRAGRAAGKRFSRLHVVQSPLSDYLRYECEWGYAFNSALGEDIRILDLSEVDYAGSLPPRDYWLFDDQSGVWQFYDEQGRYQGAELARSEEVEQLSRWRQELTGIAVPFEQYWAAHPQYHRNNR